MTKNILILGGTRFFGVRLVKLLLEHGVTVTIATRGTARDSFGKEVRRLIVERENKESLEAALSNGSWDLVYDQVCYSPTAAIIVGASSRYLDCSKAKSLGFQFSSLAQWMPKLIAALVQPS